MSFRPNYAKKPEGEEKKSKAYSFRRQHFRRNDVTDEEKAIMAMEGVDNMENAEGIIRYSIDDMLKLRKANTEKPEMADEACVIGYERLSEMLKEQADLIAEKEAVAVPATEFQTEVPNTVRVDTRVRALRNIMNQFTLDNPELITDMLYNNIDGYLEEPTILRTALESIINKCSTEALYCDAFIAVTDRDEENLLMALTAKRYGVKKVVPKMSRMGYLDIVNLTGLDTVISPKAIIASQISSYVRGLANSQGSAVESLHYILGGAIEAVEFTATSATHFLDRPLSDLHFRNGLLVAAIVHNGRMEIPNGHSQIHAGDRVIVVAKKLFLQDLNDILG